ncbi:hypothetical protein ACWG8W_06170 [Citricoccus zhacaiensis]
MAINEHHDHRLRTAKPGEFQAFPSVDDPRIVSTVQEVNEMDWDLPGVREFLVKHSDYTAAMVDAFETFHGVKLQGEALAYWCEAADGLEIRE